MNVFTGEKELEMIGRYVRTERYEEAVDHIENMMKYDVNGQYYQEAKLLYAEALQSYPRSATLHVTYGYLLLLKGFEEEALELLEHALKLGPTNQTVNDHIQTYYFVIKDVTNQNDIEQLLKNASPQLQKLLNNAMFKELQGDIKEAKELYRKAAQLDPQNETLLGLLEDATEKAHPMYAPRRMMNKIGGPGVFWVIVMTILFIVYYMMLYFVAIGIAVSYLLFVLYIWKTPKLYKRMKGRKR